MNTKLIICSTRGKITTTRGSKAKWWNTKKMKNLNVTQKFALVTILLLCASLLFIYWYRQTYTLEPTHTQEINSSNVDQKLLIAAVGSPFKDSITAKILDYYNSPHIAIEVIDLRDLANTDAAHFDAILILHRWVAGAPIEIVQSFMDINSKYKNKIVMLTTSWNGLEQTKNYDAITEASVMLDVPIYSDRIIKRLNRLLKYKK